MLKHICRLCLTLSLLSLSVIAFNPDTQVLFLDLSNLNASPVAPDEPDPVTLSSIEITGASSLAESIQSQYTATGTYSDASQSNLTTLVDWTEDNTNTTITLNGGLLTVGDMINTQVVNVGASLGAVNDSYAVTLNGVPPDPPLVLNGAFPSGDFFEYTNSYAGFNAWDAPTTNISGTAMVAGWTQQGLSGQVITYASPSNISSFITYDGSSTSVLAATWSATNLTGFGFYTNQSALAQLVWPVSGTVTGKPFRVNSTIAHHIGPKVRRDGERFSVFGRNLTSDTRLFIEGHGYVTNTYATKYRADFITPTLTAGDYTAWVHNGHMRQDGWSERPVTLTVEDRDWSTGTHTNITDFGALGNGITSDRTPLLNALSAVGDGGTVLLDDGNYALSSSIHANDLNNRRIKAVNAGNASFRETPIYTANNMFGDNSNLYNAEFDGIHFDAGGVSVNRSFHCVPHNIRFLNCEFTDRGPNGTSTGNGYDALYFHDGEELYYSNCVFISKVGCFAGSTHDQYVEDSFFYGWGGSEANCLYRANYSDRMTFINNHGTHYDDTDETSTDGWAQGRFIAYSGKVRNHYYESNTTTNFAPKYNFQENEYNQDHQNAGEGFLFEGIQVLGRGIVSASTSTNVTFSSMDNSAGVGHRIAIVSGNGFSQSRDITAVNGSTLTVDYPWEVNPASGNVFITGVFPSDLVFVDNRTDGPAWEGLAYSEAYNPPPYDQPTLHPQRTASTMVSFYGGTMDCVVDSCTMEDHNSAMDLTVTLTAIPNETKWASSPSFFNYIVNNAARRADYGYSMNVQADEGTITNLYLDAASFGNTFYNNTHSNISMGSGIDVGFSYGVVNFGNVFQDNGPE